MFKGRHDPHMEDHEQMLPAFNPFCMSYDSFRAVGVLSVSGDDVIYIYVLSTFANLPPLEIILPHW